jgi:putative membrane protein
MSAKPRKPTTFRPDDAKVVIEDEPPELAAEMITPEEAEGSLAPAAPHSRVTLSGRVPLGRRMWRWGGLFTLAASALFSLAIGLALTDLIEGLYARHEWLGHVGLGLLGLALLATLGFCVRELIALSRLRKLEHLRTTAERALRHNEKSAADTALRDVRTLYRGRKDMAWALSRLAEYDGEVIDPKDRILLAERILFSDLDAASRTIIASAAKRVSVVTAVNPAPALDVAFVAAQNLSMLRRLATLYGARPGAIGTFRLARMVIAHIAISGGLALGDSLLQQFLGRGVAGRLSAKIGEGAVNGMMTARIGIAALDLCRPIPFHVLERPTLQSVVAGVFAGAKEDKP